MDIDKNAKVKEVLLSFEKDILLLFSLALVADLVFCIQQLDLVQIAFTTVTAIVLFWKAYTVSITANIVYWRIVVWIIGITLIAAMMKSNGCI
jgi:hypothetical protein